MTENWRELLPAFYEELDREIEAKGWTCGGCGECCHFDVVEHILYASGMEREYLEFSATPAERPDGSVELLQRGKRCPFQQDGRCTARQSRPLGCRLHFCNVSDDTDFLEDWHRRLKKLHAETGYAWDYRPLLPLERRV